MNLKGRYDMLRTATLAMVGVKDDVDTLKQMAGFLQIPAITDKDAAASLLLLQTLIVTHDDYTPKSDFDVHFIITVKDGDWTGTFQEWQERRIK